MTRTQGCPSATPQCCSFRFGFNSKAGFLDSGWPARTASPVARARSNGEANMRDIGVEAKYAPTAAACCESVLGPATPMIAHP
jgi:hypothetical protein